jgi:hypothetical protein
LGLNLPHVAGTQQKVPNPGFAWMWVLNPKKNWLFPPETAGHRNQSRQTAFPCDGSEPQI